MKVLSTEGLTKLIQLIKSSFISTNDTVSTNTVTLADVATSGSYDDLTDKPTIPAAQVNSDWNAASGVAQILNKPTIPTVNNATLTITQGGTTKGTFTANASSNVTIDLESGGGTVDQTYNASSANAQSGVAINGAGFLKNTATGTNSITILGTPTNDSDALNIGLNSNPAPYESISIGNNHTYTSVSNGGYIAIGKGITINATTGGGRGVIIGNGASIGPLSSSNVIIGIGSTCEKSYSVALGSYCSAYAINSLAIGCNSYVGSSAEYGIQLGRGSNYEANSFYVGLGSSSSYNYKLLGSDGKIPDGRLPIATSVSSSSTNADVVGAKLFYDTCDSKADADLSNINPTQTVKNTIVSWGMPDYANATEMNLTTSEQSYTCPKNGIIAIDTAGFNGTYCYLKINDVTMFNKTSNSNSYIIGATGSYLVSKGDVIKAKSGYGSGFAGTDKLIFIPLKGAN